MASIHMSLKCGEKRKNIFDLGEQLKAEMNRKGAEFLCESDKILGGAAVYFLAFERYYFRNGSYASLSVMLTENGGEQTADIVGSGGGEGVFNIGWGANTNFADMAADMLRENGFVAEW